MNSTYAISTLTQLEALFDLVAAPSLKKEVDYIHPLYAEMIAVSPFAILASAGIGGLDASPRGETPGFVKVQNERTLLLPERRGNNRIDSLRNILEDPRVALLFLIPGIGETLRVNGKASITVDPNVLKQFSVEGNLPKCVIVIKVDAVYFQCARAIKRSNLWTPTDRVSIPTPGRILEALTAAAIDGNQYDAELPLRIRKTLY